MPLNLPHAKFKLGLMLTSMSLFVISLTQDAYTNNTNAITGWLPFVVGGLFFFSLSSWLANPLLFLSWFLIKKRTVRWSALVSLLATLISLTFLWVTVDPTSDTPTAWPKQIISYDIGYWLWVSSSAIMLIGSICLWLIERSLRNSIA